MTFYFPRETSSRKAGTLCALLTVTVNTSILHWWLTLQNGQRSHYAWRKAGTADAEHTGRMLLVVLGSVGDSQQVTHTTEGPAGLSIYYELPTSPSLFRTLLFSE